MSSRGGSGLPEPIEAVVAAMGQRLDRLPAWISHQRVFLSTKRTTQAVGEAIAAASFEDPEWVERWDVIFAELYLAALDTELDAGGEVPRPWRSRQHRTCPRCVTSCSASTPMSTTTCRKPCWPSSTATISPIPYSCSGAAVTTSASTTSCRPGSRRRTTS